MEDTSSKESKHEECQRALGTAGVREATHSISMDLLVQQQLS